MTGVTREHPMDRQQCPGCGGEDLTADEMERGRCDKCRAAFLKGRQLGGWDLVRIEYLQKGRE